MAPRPVFVKDENAPPYFCSPSSVRMRRYSTPHEPGRARIAISIHPDGGEELPVPHTLEHVSILGVGVPLAEHVGAPELEVPGDVGRAAPRDAVVVVAAVVAAHVLAAHHVDLVEAL